MQSPFENDTAARALLEVLRWPDGPRCPRAGCDSYGADVFLIAGEKQSHREGLYHCKICRKQFSVTVGTPLERLRIPLSAWLRAAREFSADDTNRNPNAHRGDNLVPLQELQPEIGVSYRTVLRMRDIIKRAALKYRGERTGFGAWPRSFMKRRSGALKEDTIKSNGVVQRMVGPSSGVKSAALNRTEQLLGLLTTAQVVRPRKPRPRKKRP